MQTYKELKKALLAAFPHTVPVLTGFLFLGIAYGMYMDSIGVGAVWALASSLAVFAGSAQYLCAPFFLAPLDWASVFFLTLMINARHFFYGLSLSRQYSASKALRPYLIFALCDETFSLLTSVDPPEDVNRAYFYFFVSALNHFYWSFATLLGALAGSLASFGLEGIEFSLCALFVAMFVEHLKKSKLNCAAGLIGASASICAILLAGADSFIPIAMGAIVAFLSVFRKQVAGLDINLALEDVNGNND
ncbi:MAG: AzlC family ABC transporter permease [Eubacteriaceae bacterium]|nr:AzlC family ABC transporter permease [Eubacteriaceae bacterium]